MYILKNKKVILSIAGTLILIVLGIVFKDDALVFIKDESSSQSVISYELEEKSEVITENSNDENSVVSEFITEATSDFPDSSAMNIPESSEPESESTEIDNDIILESGSYTTPEDVAEYIHTFGTLPENFITKKEAQDLGWISSEGNLWDVAYGMSIGGDRFGNYEKLLPDADGRIWTECDVNYNGGFRGSERIIFSNDGLVFYTSDHYKNFEQIY